MLDHIELVDHSSYAIHSAHHGLGSFSGIHRWNGASQGDNTIAIQHVNLGTPEIVDFCESLLNLML